MEYFTGFFTLQKLHSCNEIKFQVRTMRFASRQKQQRDVMQSS